MFIFNFINWEFYGQTKNMENGICEMEDGQKQNGERKPETEDWKPETEDRKQQNGNNFDNPSFVFHHI